MMNQRFRHQFDGAADSQADGGAFRNIHCNPLSHLLLGGMMMDPRVFNGRNRGTGR